MGLLHVEHGASEAMLRSLQEEAFRPFECASWRVSTSYPYTSGTGMH
jgi:hypothetical protein